MLSADDLQQVRLFEALSGSELKQLAKELRIVEHGLGDRVMARGSGGLGFMVILDGTVEVKTADGRTRRLGRGDHFGEMALLDDEQRSADVVAETPLRLGVIPEWSFRAFLAEHPEVTYRLLQNLSRLIREAEAG